jgi:hypothetical protein
VTKDEVDSLTAAWQTRWGGSPVAYELRGRHADRWVRFHSLPESKRYAETEEEYETILDRHHRVLTELGAGDGLYMIAGHFASAEGRVWPDPRHPGAVPWLTIESDDHTFFAGTLRLYVSMTLHDRPSLDPLLRGAADDEIGYVIIAPSDLRWLYHPYDGGADVIAPTVHDRDVLKKRHADWLSAHPAGL